MKEAQIRPADIFSEYLRLSAEDAHKIFDMSKAELRDCPACGSVNHHHVFIKNDFPFFECAKCGTLFANPLPPIEQFEEFYKNGEPARYWSQVFVRAVRDSRRELIIRPKVHQIVDLSRRYGITVRDILDVGAGPGIFLEAWREAHPRSELHALEPHAHSASECRSKGINVYEGMAETAQEYFTNVADVVTSFEVLEHVVAPSSFVRAIYNFVKPKGMAVVTTLLADGFDIQVLWDSSSSISPPHHINFCSVEGVKALFHEAGFDEVDVITPGKLDVDIVRNALKVAQGRSVELSRFEQKLLSQEEQTLAAFQSFLSENKLSSHGWVLARK